MPVSTFKHSSLVLLSAIALTAGAAHAQAQEEARVVSSVPAQGGGYNVTYEYAGRTYSTRTEFPPGPTIPVQVSAIGVTTSPVQSSNISPASPTYERPGWQDVAPEPGVVVSGGAPAVAYGAPPVYAPAPVYVQPGFAYPPPYYYPPVGLSLNLGYSRGWGGGGWRHRHWR